MIENDNGNLAPALRGLLEKMEEDRRHRNDAEEFLDVCRMLGYVPYITTSEMEDEELVFYLGDKWSRPYILANKRTLKEVSPSFRSLRLPMVNMRDDRTNDN